MPVPGAPQGVHLSLHDVSAEGPEGGSPCLRIDGGYEGDLGDLRPGGWLPELETSVPELGAKILRPCWVMEVEKKYGGTYLFHKTFGRITIKRYLGIIIMRSRQFLNWFCIGTLCVHSTYTPWAIRQHMRGHESVVKEVAILQEVLLVNDNAIQRRLAKLEGSM